MIQSENGERRVLRSTPDWTEEAINGDHLWMPTSASGDLCHVLDQDCTVKASFHLKKNKIMPYIITSTLHRSIFLIRRQFCHVTGNFKPMIHCLCFLSLFFVFQLFLGISSTPVPGIFKGITPTRDVFLELYIFCVTESHKRIQKLALGYLLWHGTACLCSFGFIRYSADLLMSSTEIFLFSIQDTFAVTVFFFPLLEKESHSPLKS